MKAMRRTLFKSAKVGSCTFKVRAVISYLMIGWGRCINEIDKRVRTMLHYRCILLDHRCRRVDGWRAWHYKADCRS